MCGIFLCLKHGEERPSISPKVKDLLKHRGPDSQQEVSFSVPSTPNGGRNGGDATSNEKLHIVCFGSVLSLRGDHTVEQPLMESQGDGQSSFLCWNGEAWSFGGTPIRGNDSAHVFNTLCHVSRISQIKGAGQSQNAISEVLAAYAGPFAFAYYDQLSNRLYCGRDFLGRRSLLYKQTDAGHLFLSSVPDSREGWLEVEADGIYYVDLGLDELKLQRMPYRSTSETTGCLRYTSSSTLQLKDCLRGGGAVPSESSLTPFSDPVRIMHRLLTQSLRARLINIPHRIALDVSQYNRPARLAILFSGGIDCTLLARLSHDILGLDEPIDLLNVAFENPRVHRLAREAGRSPYDECPDRKTAETSLEQLQLACPGRQWRLIRINVPYTEFVEHREAVVSLVYPHNTEMDLSIAAALYFAARGRGTHDDGQPFETSARVLLSGLGADELFGGYSRHLAAFQRGGLQALQDELALDISRLGQRNLGRDDRVISHWAKEARFPFLDEYLVNWALSAPLWEKCGFGQTPYVDADGMELDPAKSLLRCLALRVGLGRAANEKKRAIQFGARTAKMETNKSKGTHMITATAS